MPAAPPSALIRPYPGVEGSPIAGSQAISTQLSPSNESVMWSHHRERDGTANQIPNAATTVSANTPQNDNGADREAFPEIGSRISRSWRITGTLRPHGQAPIISHGVFSIGLVASSPPPPLCQKLTRLEWKFQRETSRHADQKSLVE
jgi:hypothetical protein